MQIQMSGIQGPINISHSGPYKIASYNAAGEEFSWITSEVCSDVDMNVLISIFPQPAALIFDSVSAKTIVEQLNKMENSDV